MYPMYYHLFLSIPFAFAGAVLRGGPLRKARLGWLLTLLSLLAAAGIWSLWRSDGSMGAGCLWYGTAFALGVLAGGFYALRHRE